MRDLRGPSLAYPLIFGAAAAALLIMPVGIGGSLQYGAWIYVAVVIAAVTFAVARILRTLFDRLAAPSWSFFLIPIGATAAGLLAGSLAVNFTLGGPT